MTKTQRTAAGTTADLGLWVAVGSLLLFGCASISEANPVAPAMDSVMASEEPATLDECPEAERVCAQMLEAWYGADPIKMDQVLHAGLAKRGVLRDPGTGVVRLIDADKERMVEGASLGYGRMPRKDWDIETRVLWRHGDMAGIEVVSAQLIDVCQVALIEGEWQIVNVIWKERRPESDGPTSSPVREVVADLFSAFNAHDLDGVMAHDHPDVVHINSDHPTPRKGAQVVRKIYADIFQGLPDVHDSIRSIAIERNRAAIEFTASWTGTDDNDAVEARELRIAAFLTIRGGKIVEDATYYGPTPLAAGEE